MKKLIALLFILSFLFTVSSCGGAEITPSGDRNDPLSISDSKSLEAFSGKGVIIKAPDEAQDISCRIVEGGISESEYSLNGIRFIFRGAESKSSISGFALPEQPDFILTAEAADVSSEVKVFTAEEGRVALWDDKGFSYSLYAYGVANGDAFTSEAKGRAAWTLTKNRFSSKAELLADAKGGFEALGFKLALPEEYERVQYHVINGAIAQAVFWKDNRYYVFRIAQGERDITDIEIGDAATPDGTKSRSVYMTGSIPINFNPGGPGLAVWHTGGRSYSLYTDICDGELMQHVLLDLAQEVQKQNEPLTSDKGYMRLWEIDLGREGYVRTGASRSCTYQSGELNVGFSICPEVYQPAAEMERIEYDGKEFFLRDNEICWDGVDDAGKWIGGTTYSRSLIWYKDGCAYSLGASAGSKSVSLDIICPQTAISLERGDIPKGLELRDETWSVGLRAGNIIVTVCLYPPPFDKQHALNYKDMDGYTLCESGGFKYYLNKPERTPDDPNFAAIIWETGEGLVCLSGGIPHSHRNDYSEDVWDYINAELALNITEQLGSAPDAMPE